jgi:adenine-specific DNA-methyltransferase
MLVYQRSVELDLPKQERAVLNRLDRSEKQDSAYRNPDNDPRGPWKAGDYTCNKSAEERPNLYYAIVHPVTGEEVWPSKTGVWRSSRDVYEQHVKDNRL